MKYKKIPVDYLPTILDRLTRFEPAYIRYNRVFDDIINKFCANIKTRNIALQDQIKLCEELLSESINCDISDIISPVLINEEKRCFKYNEVSYQYLSCRFNITSIISSLDNKIALPKNAQWLRYINKDNNPKTMRGNLSLLYPIEKILLCEGETERLLLPVILKLFDVDLDKLGVLLIASGGKNQVARKYYSMSEEIILPFKILLDKDAISVKNLIDSKLRPKDNLYLINSGEFEDLIPVDILEKAINFIHKNDLHCFSDDFKPELSTVHNIDNIYKQYGFGEYKKAHFAQDLKSYIENFCSKKDFEQSEILKIADFITD